MIRASAKQRLRNFRANLLRIGSDRRFPKQFRSIGRGYQAVQYDPRIGRVGFQLRICSDRHLATPVQQSKQSAFRRDCFLGRRIVQKSKQSQHIGIPSAAFDRKSALSDRGQAHFN
jgi:hypothetical protein